MNTPPRKRGADNEAIASAPHDQTLPTSGPRHERLTTAAAPVLAESPDERLFLAKLREFEDVARHRREIERLTAQHVGLQEKLNAEHAAHLAKLDCYQAELCRLLTAILQAMPNGGCEPTPQKVTS